MARRAGFAASYSEGNPGAVYQIDLGSYFKSRGLEAEAVNRLMLESLRLLPLDLFHLSFADLFLWKDLNGGEAPTRILSTNLVPLDETTPSPQPFAVLEVAADRLGLQRPVRIGFLGLTTPQRVKKRSGFKALDPLQAVAQWKSKAMEQADFLILLSDLPRDSQRFSPDSLIARLAGQHPEIRAILLAEKRFIFYEPETVGSAMVLSSVDRGRYLSSLRLVFDSQGRLFDMQAQNIQLGSKVREDSEFLRKQHSLAERIR